MRPRASRARAAAPVRSPCSQAWDECRPCRCFPVSMNAGTDIRAGRPPILRCTPKCGCNFRHGRAFAATDPSADRADLEHLAVIAGFEGNPELAAAIVLV